MNPRSIWLPVALVLGLAGIVRPETRTFDLITASVSDIQDAVDAGAFSYEKLVEMYLPRIEAYDKNGPKLHAVLAIQLRAIEIARGLDRERIERGWRSPLHGIPIAVKDTVHVKDVTAAGGNLALAGSFPEHDATVVQKLREARAIIFFKANLEEFNLRAQGRALSEVRS